MPKEKLGEIVEEFCCSCCKGDVTQREIDNEESDCCHAEIEELEFDIEHHPEHPDRR